MSARFDDAFLARVRDYLDVECDWFGMDEENTLPQLRAALEAAAAQSSLVVIDPEDREQVERLHHGLMARGYESDTDAGEDRSTEALTDALREFASPTPPRPDEPMGLGAVVEDEDGRIYVRTSDSVCRLPWAYANNYTDFEWSQIAVVRVLSEGVSDD